MVVLHPVILASFSETKRKILTDIGLMFETTSAAQDEEKLKEKLIADGIAKNDFPPVLAETKAREIAEKHTDFLVIGANQIFECEGQRLDKSGSRTEARQQFEYLSGKTDSLTSAVCVPCWEKAIWGHSDRAWLIMRSLSADFIDAYMQTLEEKKLCSIDLY